MVSVFIAMATYFYKDDMPSPDFYPAAPIKEPVQVKTWRKDFSVSVNDESYIIKPKFNYELEGVVVSYHNADSAWDMYHHDMWKDFLNLRDLCVIWGKNVTSGVYNDMEFDSNTWTCWSYWPDSETRNRFAFNALSNNHVLSTDQEVNRALMSAEVGDHIRFKGVLAEYENPGNGFKRGTSTNRDDKGNGACETIYIDKFEIITKANADIRWVYALAKWMAIISLIGFIVTFLAAPIR